MSGRELPAHAGASSKRHTVAAFPPERNPIVDILRQAKKRHHVYGLSSLDATVVLDTLRQIGERTGETPSLTAYVVWGVARAVAENPQMHAIRRGRKLYLFEDVDVSTIIERETDDGLKLPVTLIVRKANAKTFAQIHAEIRRAQTQRLQGMSLGESAEAKQASRFARLPGFVRALVWWWMRRNPAFFKAMLGTVNVTAVGMFGPEGGWGFAHSIWPISIVIGGIARRPGVVGDRIEIRQYLDASIGIDHEVVDGAPVARFARRLVQRFESGEGLREAIGG